MLAARGHAALLDLPAAVFKPELEPFVAAVFRHILEDPATLQARWYLPTCGGVRYLVCQSTGDGGDCMPRMPSCAGCMAQHSVPIGS